MPLTKKINISCFPQIKVVTLVENDDNTLSCLADYMPFHVDKHYISIAPTEIEQTNLLKKRINMIKLFIVVIMQILTLRKPI